ncbi:MAG: class I tRNA ligase family protein, partial [Lentisphaeria bacterium]|nr:class I tRNA ligase family protein [Lentisphaeria bacterium]
ELVDEKDLPVALPEMPDFKPTGTGAPPLAKAGDWVDATEPVTGRHGRRETNTMPQWAGSCWYYLRYIDPHNPGKAWSEALERYWMPVDLYIGGAEHAVLHLLYARFWHKVLFDLGFVSTPEPFMKLVNQGMILGTSYKDGRGVLVPTDQVEFTPGGPVRRSDGEKLTEFPAKMSKSLRNVVNPDDVIRRYGADSMRLYEMFMGPLEATKPWSTTGVEGVFRFLKRAWRTFDDAKIVDVPMSRELARLVHGTVKKVGADIEAFGFNTAISAMMVLLNDLAKLQEIPREAAEKFVLLLAPFAPHICEELWQKLGHSESLAYAPWPEFDEALLKVAEVEILVQVLGKPKARLMLPVGCDAAAAEKIVMADETVKAAVAGKTVVKVIYVPGRLVNIVVR